MISIKRRLYIYAVTVVSLSLLLLISHLVSSELQTKKISEEAVMDRIVANMNGLLILSSEWNRFDYQRIETQWEGQLRTVEKIKISEPELYELLADDIESFHHSFLALKSVREKSNEMQLGSENGLNRNTVKEEWLVSKMYIESITIVSKAVAMSNSISSEVLRIGRIASRVTFLIIVLIFCTIVFSTYILIKTTIVPLQTLLQHITAVEQGGIRGLSKNSISEDSALRLKNSSEIFIIDSAFNRMANSLFDTFQKLENEIHINKGINEELNTVNAKLLESNDNFQMVVSNISSVVWKFAVGEKGVYDHIYISPAADELLAFPAGTINHDWNKFIGTVKPKYLELVNNTIKETLNSPGKDCNCEYEILKDNGQTAWIHSNGRCYEKDGKKQIFGTSFDLTFLKQAEDKVQKSEELLRVTQELTKVGGWKMNIETQSMYWTRETYQIHEIDPDDVEAGSSKHIELSVKCYFEKDRKIINDAFQKCITEGVSYDMEFPFTTLKGNSLWVRTTARPETINGKVVNVIGNLMDITERKHAEVELEKHRVHLEKLVKERTLELEEKNEELEQFNNLFVGREFRIKELKDEVEKLEQQLSKK